MLQPASLKHPSHTDTAASTDKKEPESNPLPVNESKSEKTEGSAKVSVPSERGSYMLPIAEDLVSDPPDLVVDPPHGIMKEDLKFNFDKYRQHFSVHRQTGGKVGGFTVPQVVDLMTERTLTGGNPVDSMTHYLVTNLIGTNDPSCAYGFHFKSNMESPFMNDIESLIKLNNVLYHFEVKQMEEYLKKYLDDDIREKAGRVIKHFIYSLLHHTLKILNQLSSQIKDSPSHSKLRQGIANYTIGIVYRIARYSHDEITYFGNQLKKVNANFKTVVESREKLGSKIDQLIDVLNKSDEKPVEPVHQSSDKKIESHHTPSMTFPLSIAGGGQHVESPSGDCYYEEIGEASEDHRIKDSEFFDN